MVVVDLGHLVSSDLLLPCWIRSYLGQPIPPSKRCISQMGWGVISLQGGDCNERKPEQDSEGLPATLTLGQRPERAKKVLIDTGAPG